MIYVLNEKLYFVLQENQICNKYLILDKNRVYRKTVSVRLTVCIDIVLDF